MTGVRLSSTLGNQIRMRKELAKGFWPERDGEREWAAMQHKGRWAPSLMLTLRGRHANVRQPNGFFTRKEGECTHGQVTGRLHVPVGDNGLLLAKQNSSHQKQHPNTVLSIRGRGQLSKEGKENLDHASVRKQFKCLLEAMAQKPGFSFIYTERGLAGIIATHQRPIGTERDNQRQLTKQEAASLLHTDDQERGKHQRIITALPGSSLIHSRLLHLTFNDSRKCNSKCIGLWITSWDGSGLQYC